MKKKKFRLKNIMVTVFIFYAVFTIVHQQINITKLRKNAEAASKRVEVVNTENKKLEGMINNAGSDAYIEKMARKQLGMVKSDEKVYVLQPSADNSVEGGGD